ncbi:NepR family anti-sigma factor [Novosphingobium rosa]|uniref:NepR family anti-sigma factor n=1 Tax=Novosphingobium rosa TaxID=76978 RepID=UPI000836657F|nr:NepR family anti-sigma factor [Novosphingobium rosa]
MPDKDLPPSGSAPPTEQPTPPEMAEGLSHALRAMYEQVVDEPLPDSFADLLSRLDDSDG